ncbi:perilipin 6 [Amia ocellicauda]|uniref:perilipin 6 n=1 Tax=Amia ocellicauda TaxID=2972642 RepID=UPI003464C7F0
MSDSIHYNSEASAMLRAAQLPLVSSTLQVVASVYLEAKGRLPLLAWVGAVAELSLRSLTLATAQQAAPLLDRLEPQLAVANSYACMGLDQLEKRFPVLQQSAEEVIGHLKDALYLTLDDLQLRVNKEMDRVADRTSSVVEGSRVLVATQLHALQRSALGGALASGLDELLSRSEEAAQLYLPLSDELTWELAQRMQPYEDSEDEEGGPGMALRVRGLLLHVGLLSYHQALLFWDQVEHGLDTLRQLADTVGLTYIAETLVSVAQWLAAGYVALVYQLQALQTLAVGQLSALAGHLLSLRPDSLSALLPAGARDTLGMVVGDLRELSKILLQLLINTTPLYDLLREQAEQLSAGWTSQDDMSDSGSSRRSSSDMVPPRRPRQAYLDARSRREQTGKPSPTNANGRRGSWKLDWLAMPAEPEPVSPSPPPPVLTTLRRSSADALLAPIMQLVTQSQRAFEYLSPAPPSAHAHPELASNVAETAE